MKVYNLEDGSVLEREPVDAKEIVAADPKKYSLIDPNLKPGEHKLTAGEVLRETAKGQHDENMRSQFQQFADATAVRDMQKMEEVNPAAKARKAAQDAEKAALEARHRMESAAPAPVQVVNVAQLKAAADEAEKRAKEARAQADELTKAEEKADKELAASREKEQEVTKKIELRNQGGNGSSGSGTTSVKADGGSAGAGDEGKAINTNKTATRPTVKRK